MSKISRIKVTVRKMCGAKPHTFFRTLKFQILKFFNFRITSRIHWKRCFGCDIGTNPQNSGIVKISKIFKFSLEFYNNSCLKGMKRKLCRNLCILKHFKTSGVIWIFGGFEISSDPRNFSKITTLFLLCAFNVLHEGEKMIYWDGRNGVRKFRTCTLWVGGVRILTNRRY